MKTEFLPEADAEFREAARYYENEAAGVGIAFVAAVHKAVSEVQEFPLAAPVARASVRKKVLRHFAYNLFYAVTADTLVIIAVAHQRKRPNYWCVRFQSR